MNSVSVNKTPTITLDGNSIECTQGKSVLENIESAGVEMAYNCREGFCGVCRTKLVSGQVEYTIDPLAFIDDDEILSCCTKPITDIEVKVIY